MSTTVFVRGETVPIFCINKSWTGADMDPTEGIVITLIDPDDTAAITEAAMTRVDEGNYVYYFASDEDSVAGWWRWQCKAVDGTGVVAKTVISEGGFLLNESVQD